MPRWLDHGRELSERWINRQQIREAIGESADLLADQAEPVLDPLRWAYPFRLNPHQRPAGAQVDIAITGAPLARCWILACNGQHWQLSAPATAAIAKTLVIRSHTGAVVSERADRAGG